MRKDEFQDNAKLRAKTDQGKTGGTATVHQIKPALAGFGPPVPKAPFGMHLMARAVNIQVLQKETVTSPQDDGVNEEGKE